jgi:hypothetical protein
MQQKVHEPVNPKKKRIAKKYVYEDEHDDDEVEAAVMRKPNPKVKPEPASIELIYVSAYD